MPITENPGFLLVEDNFWMDVNGHLTDLCYITNDHISVAVTNYGARVVGLLVKDRSGIPVDVVLGFDSLQAYLDTSEVYHGAIAGRYANRIAKGKFTLDGAEYKLAVNNGENHLHGGPGGFHAVVWELIDQGDDHVTFRYLSNDGEEGYPGNLNVRVSYTLKGAALHINFEAATDKTTVLNLTNHSYFNLNGRGSIYQHQLQLNADHFTPIDEKYIPTGELAEVTGTPFDFRTLTEIGERIDEKHEQLLNGAGYDHNFVLNKNNEGLTHAATAMGDQSGIRLEVFTTEPGIQFYSGNFMEGKHFLKGKVRDDHRTGFCLETQHFPDSPNQPSFPSVVLREGEKFQSETIFSFAAQ